MFNLLCPKRSIHKIAVALVLQPCKCQALVFLGRNKSDTLEQNWRELKYEDKWVENSRVLSLYEKKNYARNVFYRKVVEQQ